MKNLIGVLYLFSGLCFGQFYESNNSFFESSSQSENQYFHEEEPEENQIGFFYSEYINPDYGEDGPPNPETDPVPIDEWIFILPLMALVGGVYCIKNKKKLQKNSSSN